MEDFFEFIKLKWSLIEIVKIYEFDDLIQYRYRINLCEDYECGILELDKDDIARLGRKECVNIMELLISGKMVVLQPFTGNDNLNIEGHDLSIILAFHFIAEYYLKNDYSFLERVEYLNYKLLEYAKENYPEDYQEIMDWVNEEERKLKN